MRLQTTYNTRGFLLSEIVIAFSLMTLFMTSAVVLSSTMNELRQLAIKKSERMQWITRNISSTTLFTLLQFGNDSIEKRLDPITLVTSDYINAWGRDTCEPRFNLESPSLYKEKIDIGLGNSSTDLEVRNGFVYLTADSTTASYPDFYIIDNKIFSSPYIVSALNTGPGLSSIEIAGPYAYVSNRGSTNQLQIIDISNRQKPVLISKLKLPLPDASSTAPLATTLFYRKGVIYLGTEKWEGTEFNVIDVSNPRNPIYIGGFDTNTLINNIYIQDTFAYAAASDEGQMRVLDISDPSNITQISKFSPSGWETQQGKIISYFENELSLGRTSGGFNNVKNHEVFNFSSTSDLSISRDIPTGVYGIIFRPPNIFLATHSLDNELQVYSADLSSKKYEIKLGFLPQAMACDHYNIYFATGDHWGMAMLKNKYER